MVNDNGDGTFSAVIDGKNYMFGKWTADKACLMWAELMGMAGNGITEVSKTVEGAEDVKSVGVYMALAKVLMDFMGRDPARTLRVLKSLACDAVKCEGNDIPVSSFGIFYQEDIFHAMQVAAANAEVQFKKAFTTLAPYIRVVRAKLADKKEKADPSPTKT